MWLKSGLAAKLCTIFPVIQGGMAGGVTTPEFVAAVSNAGGLGTLGAGYLSAEQIRSAIRSIKILTNRPFAVNLFVPENPVVSNGELDDANRVLSRFRLELGITAPPDVTQFAQPSSEQVAAVLEEQVPVFSFTFGIFAPDVLESFHRAGTLLIGTATTVQEALAVEAAGVDIVVAQGAEAGAHRGTFASDFATSMVGTMALIPQVVDRVQIPVIAAGGIADGRGIVAALALGAAGVQIGTGFLTAQESGAHILHKQAVLASTDDSTSITRAFSGKPARGIRNAFTDLMQPHESSILPYPVQNAFTQDIRKTAGIQGKSEYMSLWAGQASPMARQETVAAYIERLDREVVQVLQTLFSSTSDRA
jgi:nitronate monooxygenase